MSNIPLDKIVRIGLLMDIYGDLLTEKQRNFVKMHYEDDMSFQEIAETANISRQAVFDAVKNAEESLENFESKLNLISRFGLGDKSAGDNKEPNSIQTDSNANLSNISITSEDVEIIIENLKGKLTNLKNKVAKQGVIYNTKWIITELDNIINEMEKKE